MAAGRQPGLRAIAAADLRSAGRGGKVYGKWPGLAPEQRFEGRDLAVTTDFRDVLSEIVTRHLGAAPDAVDRVFPGFTPGAPLGIIRA